VRALTTVLLLAALAAPAAAAPTRFLDEVFAHVKVDRALQYGEAPGRDGAPEKLVLDLYRPLGDHRARRPVMVWVHGGGFSSGHRDHRTLRRLALGSARRGFVAVSVDYRILVTHGCAVLDDDCQAAAISDQHDVQAAIRWVRRHAALYRLDPTRVAVGGTSVGGVLSYMVGTRADDPGDSGNPGFSSAVRCFVSISGGYPGGGGFANTGDAPGLLFHGTADDVVPYSWSVDAVRALHRAGVPAKLETIPRGRHVAYEAYHDRYDRDTARFLVRRMGL